MSRARRAPSVVWITCTDPWHRDTRDWQEHGFRLVARLQFAERAETSPAPRVTLQWDVNSPNPPVKNRRREDGEWVFRFTCSCGKDVQRDESYLVETAQRYAAAFPGQRVELDLVRIA